jgi:hypothetical protein
MELQVYKARIDPSIDSDLEVNYIGLVDRPAIERNFQAFKAQQKKSAFILNEEKRIISGPAMIADMPIYRKDDQLGEYYVVFDKAAIQTIVEKFSAKGYLKNFNLFHDAQKQVNDVTIFNSFVSDTELGITPMTGFEDVADGSWFISAKVNNPTVWEAVKAGSIKGFSVEGLFNYVPVSTQKMSTSNDLTLEDIAFLEDAICQHQETLQAAILVGKDSQLYELAQSIIKTQTEEIQQMKDLLGKGYVPSGFGVEKAMRRIERIVSETKCEE